MAADVLLYNALNEVNRCLITQNATLDANIACQNSLCTTAQNTINSNAPSVVANSGPNQANMWCLIPTLPATGCSWTGSVCVYDTSGFFRCGASCSWTVPAGVTCARFQIWGAGAGSGSACCCGFSPIGGTGAYASVIIPVTAGCTYTLCAGCAHCCYACRAQNTSSGCASYVTGTGLTNFCAEGGEANKICEIKTRGQLGATVCNLCRYLGACFTNYGTDMCWSGNLSSVIGTPGGCFDAIYPMISSCKTYYGSATSGTVYGIRGSFGSISVTCTGAICVAHPPIYGYASSSCCTCCVYANYQQGCARSVPNGYMVIPGAGGWAGFKCGGATNCAGDSGRAGMVCVSFR
jgi:hypothetical protein